MRLLALLALLAAPLTAYAQTTFGLTAGLNAATISFEDEEDIDGVDKQARLGLVAGAFARIPVTPMLSVQPEILYSQRGVKQSIEENDLGIEGSFTTEIDYIEVPLMLRYAIPATATGLEIGLEAGPSFGYRLNAGVSCSGDFEDAGCELDEEAEDEISTFDVGAAVGASVGAGPFSVALRYTHGFTSIDDTEDEAFAVDAFNRVVSVTARYTFGQ